MISWYIPKKIQEKSKKLIKIAIKNQIKFYKSSGTKQNFLSNIIPQNLTITKTFLSTKNNPRTFNIYFINKSNREPQNNKLFLPTDLNTNH